jgi:hypothetical protein
MNKAVIIGLVVFGGLGYAWQSGAIPLGGSGYRVEFTGTPGAKLTGVVGWKDAKNFANPTHLDKAEGTLPLTVSVNPPPGSIVVATGNSFGQGDVTIRIYHNGVECGKSPFEGTAKLNGKVCQP